MRTLRILKGLLGAIVLTVVFVVAEERLEAWEYCGTSVCEVDWITPPTCSAGGVMDWAFRVSLLSGSINGLEDWVSNYLNNYQDAWVANWAPNAEPPYAEIYYHDAGSGCSR